MRIQPGQRRADEKERGQDSRYNDWGILRGGSMTGGPGEFSGGDKMRLAVGSDERAYVTDQVTAELEKRGHAVTLFGPLKGESLNWTQVAQAVAEEVAQGRADEGILFCWTGTGVSLAANKVPGIRAALCHDAETAKGARLWNLANVLCLSLRTTSETVAKEILDAWFDTPPGTDPSDVQAVVQVGEIEHKYAR